MGSNLFKVGFDIHDYHDILPKVADYRQDDEVMNLNEPDLDKCIWQIDEPKIITPDYIEREVKRVLRTGAWVVIKGMAMWLPPNYYFFLRYFNAGGVHPEFRINRLMSVYEKIRVRQNPKALGTITVKSRQIGETTMEMSDCLWEAANMDYGLLGMQSKTRDTVKNSCWRTLIMGWNGIPRWLKKAIYPNFASGDKTAETMKFKKEATEDDKGQDVLIAFAAGSHNAFDSVSNMRRCILDEWLKWEEASPYATFLNYEKFIATGTTRKGLFSIFSSPADVETKYIKETFDFWEGSDPEKLVNGTTSTRVHRLYTSPLTGIEGFYDKWGDADANEIYDHIMAKRKSVPKEYRMGEIRAYPLSKEEIFGSFDGGQVFSNHKGIVQRKLYVINQRFKDNETKEPKCVYGNLEWKDGIRDNPLGVNFRQADRDSFDVIDARFAVPYMPQSTEPFRINSNGSLKPPALVESCLGIDPIDKRYITTPSGKGFSNAGMTAWKFSDILKTGIVKCPTLFYSCRPSHADIFFEDAIKAAVFTRSLVQTESINSKIIDYFEDRGYSDWMLARRGHARNSRIKGDSPSGKGMFLTEMMFLIDNVTNTPLNEGDPYLLENFWIWELLDDIIKFNPKNTQEYDGTMSFGQALMGAVKILNKKIAIPSIVNDYVFDFLLN